jgi:isopenicillin N synthase-like dioxygenase
LRTTECRNQRSTSSKEPWSFFRLPADTKRTILRTPTNPRGYVEREFTKRKTDGKECFDFTDVHDDEFADGSSSRPEEKRNRWLDEETLPGCRYGTLQRGRTLLVGC